VDGDVVVLGPGRIQSVTFMGSRYRIVVDIGDRPFAVEVNRGGWVPDGGATALITWPVFAGVLVPCDNGKDTR
jgi:hypothetical protein